MTAILILLCLILVALVSITFQLRKANRTLRAINRHIFDATHDGGLLS